MKKQSFRTKAGLILGVMGLFGATVKAVEKPTYKPRCKQRYKTTYKTTATLNLRSGASTKHKVLLHIPKGKALTYVSKSGSWFKVKYGEHTGFVSSKYVKTTLVTVKSAVKATPTPFETLHQLKPVAKHLL